MIIDAHTHAYDEAVRADPVAWARKRGEAHWLELVAPEKGASLQGWVSRETMLADMDEAGVEQAVLLGWYWEHFETCQEHNRWMARWIKQSPSRFHAFASMNACGGKATLDEVKRAHEAGFVGIGEVHPSVQGFSMRDVHWLKIVEYAAEHGLPINFHVSEPVGRPHAGRVPTDFDDFLWLAKEYPELKIILAHWGGLLALYELNPYVKKVFKNVYYDTAASPLLYDQKVWRSVVDVVGAQKIFYGSDYPLRVYPKTQFKAEFKSFLEDIGQANLTLEERASILGGNATTLFICGD